MTGETNEVTWRGVRPVAGIDGVWPGRDAVRVHANAANEAEGTVVVYTVPAGKKMYLSNLVLSGFQSDEEKASARVTVRNDSDVEQYYAAELRFEEAGQLVVSCHFVPALEAEAGWDIVLTNEVL